MEIEIDLGDEPKKKKKTPTRASNGRKRAKRSTSTSKGTKPSKRVCNCTKEKDFIEIDLGDSPKRKSPSRKTKSKDSVEIDLGERKTKCTCRTVSNRSQGRRKKSTATKRRVKTTNRGGSTPRSAPRHTQSYKPKEEPYAYSDTEEYVPDYEEEYEEEEYVPVKRSSAPRRSKPKARPAPEPELDYEDESDYDDGGYAPPTRAKASGRKSSSGKSDDEDFIKEMGKIVAGDVQFAKDMVSASKKKYHEGQVRKYADKHREDEEYEGKSDDYIIRAEKKKARDKRIDTAKKVGKKTGEVTMSGLTAVGKHGKSGLGKLRGLFKKNKGESMAESKNTEDKPQKKNVTDEELLEAYAQFQSRNSGSESDRPVYGPPPRSSGSDKGKTTSDDVRYTEKGFHVVEDEPEPESRPKSEEDRPVYGPPTRQDFLKGRVESAKKRRR